jgi:hypothetical protein
MPYNIMNNTGAPMIDVSSLSYEEVQNLEKQIKEYYDSKKGLRGYKVTFCVLYNPKNHEYDMLVNEEDFGEWFVNAIPDQIGRSFNLKRPEEVILDSVEIMDDEEIEELQ